MIWLPLLLSIAAAFADVIGGSITLFRRLSEKQMVLLTAIGSGFLLGATILDRLPESMEGLSESGPVYILIGYLMMLLLERFGFTHSHTHTHSHHNEHTSLMNQKTGIIAFIGLLVHTFLDGVIIAGTFAESRTTGILIFLAIAMHKLPEGFSMAAVGLASGYSRGRAFGSSIGLAVSTILGASLTLWIGTHDSFLIKVVMAVGTGTFIFITTTSLIPAVKSSRESKHIWAIVLSVGFFYLSLLLIKNAGLG